MCRHHRLTLRIIARFTGQPVVLGGSVNATLDTNTATFPLDKTFYMDFTQ